MATAAQRVHVVAALDFLHAHAAQLDYPLHDNRDNRDAHDWHLSEGQLDAVLRAGGRVQMDCSEVGSWVLKAAGLWRWSEPGWTGSHLQLLTQHYTDPRIALPGALVVFGPGGGDHEGIVHTPSIIAGNPLIAGHGRPGFDLEPLHTVAARHRPPVTFLSIAHL